MSLFKKQGKKEENEEIKKEAVSEISEQKPKAEEGRRFFCVIEQIFQFPEDDGVKVIGVIHGTIRLDDVIYITTLHKSVIMAVADGLQTVVNGELQELTEATDIKVAILFHSVKERGEIDQFSVLSNIRPQEKLEADRAVENPALAGLLYEFERMNEDPVFFNWFLSSIAHAKFITPVKLSRKLVKNEDGKTAHVQKETEIAFRMLESKLDEESCVLPVFTDWSELAKWQVFVSEAGSIETWVTSFPECVAITDRPACDGFLINPFGEHQCLINKRIIELITKSDGYQREFCGKTD